jgi:hypothetical protein
MNKTLITLVSALAILLVVIALQYQTINRLRLELAAAGEESTRARQEVADAAEKKSQASASEGSPASGDQQKQKHMQELESEVLRLRGLANRGIRAEAEATQLRAESRSRPASPPSSAPEPSATPGTLVSYLGDPVDAPANLEPAYTKEGLQSALQLAASTAGVTLKKLEIDTSEFPFLVGVTSDQEADFEKIKNELKKVSAYTYGGGVSGHNSYVFNITPFDKFPPGQNERISRRTTLREQMFFDQISR